MGGKSRGNSFGFCVCRSRKIFGGKVEQVVTRRRGVQNPAIIVGEIIHLFRDFYKFDSISYNVFFAVKEPNIKHVYISN